MTLEPLILCWDYRRVPWYLVYSALDGDWTQGKLGKHSTNPATSPYLTEFASQGFHLTSTHIAIWIPETMWPPLQVFIWLLSLEIIVLLAVTMVSRKLVSNISEVSDILHLCDWCVLSDQRMVLVGVWKILGFIKACTEGGVLLSSGWGPSWLEHLEAFTEKPRRIVRLWADLCYPYLRDIVRGIQNQGSASVGLPFRPGIVD